MLHLIYQSPLESATLERTACGDSLLFLGNALFRLLKTATQATELEQISKTHSLFVLEDEIQIRGIDSCDLVTGITVINYEGFVNLTIENASIHTWN